MFLTLVVASCSVESTDGCGSLRRWVSPRCTSACCRRRRWRWILASTLAIWPRASWPDRCKLPTTRLSCLSPSILHRYFCTWIEIHSIFLDGFLIGFVQFVGFFRIYNDFSLLNFNWNQLQFFLLDLWNLWEWIFQDFQGL